MNGSESERHQAGGEARRDVQSRGAHPSAGGHYDALLRYLRGLYVRAPKSATTAQKQAATQAGSGTEVTTPTGPKSQPSGPAEATPPRAEPGS